MKIKIPFSIVPIRVLSKASSGFYGLGNIIAKRMPKMKLYLEMAEMPVSAQNYLAMCLVSSAAFFMFIFILMVLSLFSVADNFLVISLFSSILITLFVFFQQTLYPKLVAGRKIRDIERNVLPALQDMLVQLNSGIPLFTVLVNISKEKYGLVSKEFEKAVNQISAGIPQVEVLDRIAKDNSSLYFRRAIWQLVNGMKTGADTAIVIREVIKSLSEEQLIQVQRYGGQLNPLAMFYMLITVIMPSLGMTFLIILFSFVGSSELVIKMIFWSLYLFVLFFQIIFLGIIKTKRPTLLER